MDTTSQVRATIRTGSPTGTQIDWDIFAEAPLFIKRLTLNRNSSLAADQVQGDLAGGTSTNRVMRSLQVGATKFDSIKAHSSDPGLLVNLTYDGVRMASNVTTSKGVLPAMLAQEHTLVRAAVGIEELVDQVAALSKNQEEILATLTEVKALLALERKHRISDVAPMAGGER